MSMPGRETLQAAWWKASTSWSMNYAPESEISQQVVEAVVVGNTAMHHLFAGLPVQQLGHAPMCQ
jgi:uncharacterized 2Fe-2S/4Fe-4S cluster protein (DUF4445 family)